MTLESETPIASQRFYLGDAEGAVVGALQTLAAERASARLWAGDATLFSDDPAHAASVATRLGWLRSPAAMQREQEQLIAFAREAHARGLRRALVLGMGGSALCPEVLAKVYGSSSESLTLRVLDTTDPTYVLEAARFAEPRETLFIVASKSGSTIEVSALEATFFERAQAALGAGAAQHFIAITDPGSPLTELANARGYARVFENDPNIGGRYSALSHFGLVPAALAGVDLKALLQSAEAMVAHCSPEVPDAENPGLQLGAFIGGLARAGRDKLSLIASPEVAPLGAWIEQLVAESTGKQGVGVVPVDQEPLADAASYGADRAFVYLRYGAQDVTALDARVEQLLAAGHPVARIDLTAKHELGGEFFRWEIATSLASALLRVNPFDEPNVTEAKRETARFIQELIEQGALPERPGLAPTAPEVGAFLRDVSPPNYLAICAYLTPSQALDARLATLRAFVQGHTRSATTTGYGPRFLHSTGQLHKGGPPSGRFLVLTMDDPHVAIPGLPYSFGQLKRAQALGDLAVLERRGRTACHVHLGSDPVAGLEALLSALR
ncbi:MAG: hypothetical protein KIT72_18735 [Polyangiaceae bacterium]|nr:hypothetical protein [Polyangiaceae bacterium]MCW5792456.1 hypothetical protein [Polyangiaceae bacterium]